ncbi:MAG: hypothetical protein KIS67_27565 [Verrucomicrobiae bacterium]|nr:hypothetical protein [Verrucomicrobiae bacterium]
MNNNAKDWIVTLLRWLARALVLGVFVLWGSFFVAHTQEWFIAPLPQLPPLKVWVGHALHLLLLVGLLGSLRWPRAAGLVVVVAAFTFFLQCAGSRFPVFFGLTVLPVLLLALCTRRIGDRAAVQI